MPGYPTKPELQMKWFLDQATAVRNAAIAHGRRGFAAAISFDWKRRDSS